MRKDVETRLTHILRSTERIQSAAERNKARITKGIRKETNTKGKIQPLAGTVGTES
jgi:hypothetical protein